MSLVIPTRYKRPTPLQNHLIPSQRPLVRNSPRCQPRRTRFRRFPRPATSGHKLLVHIALPVGPPIRAIGGIFTVETVWPVRTFAKALAQSIFRSWVDTRNRGQSRRHGPRMLTKTGLTVHFTPPTHVKNKRPTPGGMIPPSLPTHVPQFSAGPATPPIFDVPLGPEFQPTDDPWTPAYLRIRLLEREVGVLKQGLQGVTLDCQRAVHSAMTAAEAATEASQTALLRIEDVENQWVTWVSRDDEYPEDSPPGQEQALGDSAQVMVGHGHHGSDAGTPAPADAVAVTQLFSLTGDNTPNESGGTTREPPDATAAWWNPPLPLTNEGAVQQPATRHQLSSHAITELAPGFGLSAPQPQAAGAAPPAGRPPSQTRPVSYGGPASITNVGASAGSALTNQQSNVPIAPRSSRTAGHRSPHEQSAERG